jgi:WD40 repeat protein
MAFSADRTLLATGWTDNTAHVWRIDGERPEPVRELALDAPINTLAFGPADQSLAFALDTSTVHIFDRDGAETHRLTHPATVRDLAFSVDGALLTTAARNLVRVFDVA